MKNSIKKIFILGILAGCFFRISAQEILTGIGVNRAIIDARKSLNVQNIESKRNAKSDALPASLTLPFVDDFSNYSVFPDAALWMDKQAFINTGYAINPPTLGVATLDCIDAFGQIYSHASSEPFNADTLTSRPIRLDSLFGSTPRKITLGDSIYFSFYYQPGGGISPEWERLGNAPEKWDSLIVDFGYEKDSVIIWKKVWSTAGCSLDTFMFRYGVYFRQIMIPVLDTVYLNPNFQFRFRNIASLDVDNNSPQGWASNVDQWNIDYVRLNVNRSYRDTTINDVCFVDPAESVLKHYQAMPWSQFKDFQTQEMRDVFLNKLSNLDTLADPLGKGVCYNYTVFAENKDIVYEYPRAYNGYEASCENILPFTMYGYQTAEPQAKPPVLFKDLFPKNNKDSALFHIQHVFKANHSDARPQNDTNIFIQKFYNYYAYDDGTAEGSYSLKSSSTAHLAVRVVLNRADTLRAVRFFFNHVLNEANQQPFDVMVWSPNGGEPGAVLATIENCYPQTPDSLNGFASYHFEEPVSVSGTIYVGFRQHHNTFLNLGFDQNNDSHDFFMYKTGSTWESSFKRGTPMIRAVVGKYFDPVVSVEETPLEVAFEIYPNPNSSSVLHVNLSDLNYEDYTISIFTVSGQKIMETLCEPTLNIGNLSPGLYLTGLKNKKTQAIQIKKLVVQR